MESTRVLRRAAMAQHCSAGSYRSSRARAVTSLPIDHFFSSQALGAQITEALTLVPQSHSTSTIISSPSRRRSHSIPVRTFTCPPFESSVVVLVREGEHLGEAAHGQMLVGTAAASQSPARLRLLLK